MMGLSVASTNDFRFSLLKIDTSDLSLVTDTYFGSSTNTYGLFGPREACYLDNNRIALTGSLTTTGTAFPVGFVTVVGEDLQQRSSAVGNYYLHDANYYVKGINVRCDAANDVLYVGGNLRYAALHPYY